MTRPDLRPPLDPTRGFLITLKRQTGPLMTKSLGVDDHLFLYETEEAAQRAFDALPEADRAHRVLLPVIVSEDLDVPIPPMDDPLERVRLWVQIEGRKGVRSFWPESICDEGLTEVWEAEKLLRQLVREGFMTERVHIRCPESHSVWAGHKTAEDYPGHTIIECEECEDEYGGLAGDGTYAPDDCSFESTFLFDPESQKDTP